MSVAHSDPVARVGGLSKRAPRACESCRARKVRCDVTRMRAPCTNCKLDCKDCVLPASRRRHVGDRILGSSFFVDKKRRSQSPICDAIIDFSDSTAPLPQNTDLDATSRLIGDATFDVFELSASPLASFDKRKDSNTSQRHNVVDDTRSPQTSNLTSYPSPTQTLSDHPSRHWMLPNYIAPIPQSISEEDLQYLTNKGVFEVPDEEARLKLLRAYVAWVHPFAPMLELEETLTAIFSNGEEGTVSLLVFQAMLFAASAYISTDGQHRSRKRMRQIFYEHARLLHDFDIETDRLAICQAAILLSFWDGQPDSVRDSYHWIGVATLHASSLGMNAAEVFANPKRQRVFKKTWWTLLVRDRLLSVAVRRPVQNKVFRFDVPMLHLVDFRAEAFVETLRRTLKLDGLTIDVLETLVSLWLALAQLSEYIDRVLSLQYAAQRTSTKLGGGAPIVSLVPRMNTCNSAEIIACGQELQNWYGYLPSEVQELSPGQDGQLETEVIRVHTALLASYYSMTLMTLYRPTLNLPTTGSHESTLRRESIKVLSEAAKSVTDIFKNLYCDNLISRLPDTAIAALEPAVTTHLINSMSENRTVRETGFQKFYLCWRILLQFKQTYHIAETTMSMLDAAAKRLKSLPDVKALKAAAFSQLMDGFAIADEEAVKSYMAVPLVGIVDDRMTGQSDVSARRALPEQQGEVIETLALLSDSYIDSVDVGIDVGVEQSNFDQLMCWDDFEEELPPQAK